jgi:predicted nuclease of predicted toxin-antitoxin system
MTYRLLLDENVEHEVRHRLENYGHDVEHIDYVPALGKGTDDTSIGAYSLQEDRVIVTYDDDFVVDLDPNAFRAVVYFDDVSLTAKEIADILHVMSERYPQEELRGVESAGRESAFPLRRPRPRASSTVRGTR